MHFVKSLNQQKMRQIKEIIIHCTATEAGKDFSVKDIRTWHVQKGWKDVGYHYIIRIDGTIEKGRDISKIGAHCKNHNSYSIGICYVGGLLQSRPSDTRTKEQRSALVMLLTMLLELFPNAKIYGHRDFAKKDCPCFDAKKEYAYILNS